MSLSELIAQKERALVERWIDAILDEHGVGGKLWRQQRDPFANPVGNTYRTELPHLLHAAASPEPPGTAAASALDAVLRVRAVQDLSPSQAVGFVWRLREIVREEVPGASLDDLAAFDRQIERLGMQAFDVYVRLREQVFQLRLNELKRSVGGLLRRWNIEAGTLDMVEEPPLITLNPVGGEIRRAGACPPTASDCLGDSAGDEPPPYGGEP